MSPRDTGGDSPGDNPGDSLGLSLAPDPTRPVPSQNRVTVSQPSNGDQGAGKKAGRLSLDELADAKRRARQAGISDAAIKAGTQEFERRPHPKGPGLLRTLINDAAEAERTNRQAEEATQARRQAIDACSLCDDNGMYYANGTAQRCNHKPETAPKARPEAPQNGKQHTRGQSPQKDKPTRQKSKEPPF
ncbi:hypothetical protein V5S76_10390 [Corynebacterium marquesiae]|uniref:Uncharacterized protein n=1 Tax=Corynebacterium marquesiae TaxID=2913503 RepID=A0ABU8P6S8_9CORY